MGGNSNGETGNAGTDRADSDGPRRRAACARLLKPDLANALMRWRVVLDH
jgi:hypothetical protein